MIHNQGGEAVITASERIAIDATLKTYLYLFLCFRSYRECLGPGERGVIMIIATDRKQARVIMRYLTAILQSVPMLAAMIERQDTDSIDLNNPRLYRDCDGLISNDSGLHRRGRLV
jgi:hypothetical protein